MAVEKLIYHTKLKTNVVDIDPCFSTITAWIIQSTRDASRSPFNLTQSVAVISP